MITGSAVNSLNVAYDTDSIMHYPSWAFQAAPGLHTIVKKDGTVIQGNRKGLSALDIEQAKRLYCSLATTSPPTTSTPGKLYVANMVTYDSFSFLENATKSKYLF